MSKLKVVWTSQFKKDYKAAMKSHLDMDLLDDVIRSLANQEEQDPKYKGHPLSGNRKSFMECHIRPDWLLISKSRTTSLSCHWLEPALIATCLGNKAFASVNVFFLLD